VLKAIENANEKAGQLISSLLGVAWTVMTYFVVPVLVVEKVGPLAAIGRSMQILRKTWGESLVGKIGVGFFRFLLRLPGIAVLVIGSLIVMNQHVLGAAVIVLGLAYLLAWSAAGAALNGIFLSALYQYAEVREVPEGFDSAVLEKAFGHR